MKKKSSKSKKSTTVITDVMPDGQADFKIKKPNGEEEPLIAMAYDGGEWKSKLVSAEELVKALSTPEMKVLPVEELSISNVRTVTVVAETPNWEENGVTKSKKLETGRAIAQAGHAVSKLKLSYVIWLSQGAPDKAYGFALEVLNQPITSIIVKARDTNELYHIKELARQKGLHIVDFQDDNPGFYKTHRTITTAISIGPHHAHEFYGVTDYLPLWQHPADPVP